MSNPAATADAGRMDPHRLGHSGSHVHRGPSPKRIVVGYGFWLFLLSDFVLFSGLFATYAVLADATAGGPSGRELFHLGNAGLETICLLLSSFCCGLASLAVASRSQPWTQLALIATGVLGLIFLLLEIREFAHLILQGAGPRRSAFLSAFFTLVGCHGLHVTVGLLWLGTMMAQILTRGFRDHIMRRFMCFNLFWHALDIIWVAIFTVVYLIGDAR